MQTKVLSILATIAALAANAAPAQDVALTSPELSTSGEAYLDTISRHRIATDVVYFDPTAAAPELDTQAQIEAAQSDEDTSREGLDIDWPLGLSAAAVIALIIFLFIRFGGNMGIVLQPTPSNPAANRRSATRLRRNSPVEARNLAQIIQIADRREALILLAQNALHKAVTANGLLLQQSWTDRETLRRLPASQHHLAALKELVLASERVQFGGRDVTEPEFKHHVTQMTPLFRELAA